MVEKGKVINILEFWLSKEIEWNALLTVIFK